MKKFISILLITICLCAVACGVYLSDYYHAEAVALERVENSDFKVDSENGQIVFVPAEEVKTGLIFYPGGKVQYESYVPLMEELAEEGILCVLLHMPGNLAVLDMDAADGIQEQYPEVDEWYIGGHSLGGAMAASYASECAEDYEGLLLLAAYSTADLSSSDLNVISLYGSEDKILKMDSYNENRSNLPEDYKEYIIDGGCHSGFAYYGEQDGDGIPTITQEEQIEKTVKIFVKNL